MIEISPLWREVAVKMQDNGQRFSALTTLLQPLTKPLKHYTIGDLAFVIGELKALGLPNDAAAIAEEALKSE